MEMTRGEGYSAVLPIILICCHVVKDAVKRHYHLQSRVEFGYKQILDPSKISA